MVKKGSCYITAILLAAVIISANAPAMQAAAMGESVSGWAGQGYSDTSATAAEKASQMCDEILGKIITPGMDTDQKIKAVYDFLIYQYIHIKLYDPSYQETTKDESKKIEYHIISPFSNQDGAMLYFTGNGYLVNVIELLVEGEGVCDQFAATFAYLLKKLDIDALIIGGDYVSRNGSASPHAWNYVNVDGTWYWYDVDVEGSVFRRGSDKKPLYFLYKKDTDYWKTNHSWDWDESTVYGMSRNEIEQRSFDRVVAPLYIASSSPAAGEPSGPATAPTAAVTADAAAPADASENVSVIINGKAILFDVPPQIVNGRTLVPLRAIFEEMGATVGWDNDTQTVTGTKGKKVVLLTIGSVSPTINGRALAIDQPAVVINGRTLAPLRFVAEAFGGTVIWDGATQTATITMP